MNKNIDCPLCGNDRAAFITSDLRFERKADVYRCPGCELVFLDQNSFELPAGFYEKEYHQSYLTHVEPDALNPEAYFKKMLKVAAPWADRFVEKLRGNETVLDMGCSTGHFIQMIRDRAGAVYGHDLNVKEISYCKEVLGLDVTDQPLEERFGEGTFDYITLVFVLEHIAEPVAFLKHLKKFLKPQGKLLIVVPDISDPLVSFYDIPEFRSFYYCIEHLFYYNKKSISLLFDQAGLSGTIEQVQEYPLSNHLNWAYRRQPSDSVSARRGVPDVPLGKEGKAASWEAMWRQIDAVYREFLLKNGYADRLWCLVG